MGGEELGALGYITGDMADYLSGGTADTTN